MKVALVALAAIALLRTIYVVDAEDAKRRSEVQQGKPPQEQTDTPQGRSLQFAPANPVAAYRLHNAQSNSVFGIAPNVHISRTTDEQSRRDIHGADWFLSCNKERPATERLRYGPPKDDNYDAADNGIHWAGYLKLDLGAISF